MKAKKIVRLVSAVLLVLLLAGGIYLDSLLPIVTGFAAKNLASAVFVSGRDAAQVESVDLNFSLIRFAHNTVDDQQKTVTSRFLWRSSTALYREGYGVTLLRGRAAAELERKAYPLPEDTVSSTPLPAGDSAVARRLAPIATSFVDDRHYGGTPFAFLVLHQGKVVAERYAPGISPQTKLLSWSMAKSVTQALVGIMAGDSLVQLDAPLPLPEWQGDDRRTITLNQLLQMQSGLEWEEDYGNRTDVNLMLHCEEDMGLYALSKPLKYQPGTHWYYSSGSTNIVMRYLRSLFPSDKDFLSYLHDRLFAPLGIRNAVFETDMSGTPVGSSYLYMTTADFARFGQLYLDDGCVGAERVLPAGWVDYTRTPASDSQGAYGSFFWLNRNRSLPDVPEDMYYCDGFNGQRIFIIPSRQLVVVILGFSPKPNHLIDFNALLKDLLDNTSSFLLSPSPVYGM